VSRAEYIVMATARAKPGKEADLENTLRDAVESTRRQCGCLSFHLFRPLDAPGTISAEPSTFVRVEALTE